MDMMSIYELFKRRSKIIYKYANCDICKQEEVDCYYFRTPEDAMDIFKLNETKIWVCLKCFKKRMLSHLYCLPFCFLPKKIKKSNVMKYYLHSGFLYT